LVTTRDKSLRGNKSENTRLLEGIVKYKNESELRLESLKKRRAPETLFIIPIIQNI